MIQWPRLGQFLRRSFPLRYLVGPAPSPTMDINRGNFAHEIVKILEEVAESDFVALDFEFSGVACWRPSGSQKPSLQEYYEDIKAAAEKYQILQAGFTIVRHDVKENRYVARPYNFNVSPVPNLRERQFTRDWSYNSGAVSFLARNNFKFDEPISSGVHYLSRSEEQLARQNMINEENSRGKMGDMKLKPEDDVLVQHIRSELRKWQTQAKEQREHYVNIPNGDAQPESGIPLKLNRYQVRLTHQIVRNEYPGLETTGMGHFVQVTHPSAEQKASKKVAAGEGREHEIARAIGLRWLIEGLVGGSILKIPIDYVVTSLSRLKATGQNPKQYLINLQEKLRSRRRVVVGHNCFTDFVYLYKGFLGPLPETVDGFASALNDLFPGVIDTKMLASFGASNGANTSLEEVEIELRRLPGPEIEVPAEYDLYAQGSRIHEAGYDSYLTAVAAIKLSAKLECEKKYVSQVGQMASLRGNKSFGESEDVFYDATTRIEDNEEALEVDTPESPAAITPMRQKASTSSSSSAEGTPNSANNVPQITSRLASINPFAVLGTDEALRVGQPGHSKKQDGGRVVERMPAWDNSKFWTAFGNKLQVNSSREGVCKLD